MPFDFSKRIGPVEVDKFRYALAVFSVAAEMKGPFPNPEQHSVRIQDDDNSVTELRFTDKPMNRGLIAIKKEFPPQEFQIIAYRIMCLPDIVRDAKLIRNKLVRTDNAGQLEVHDAVLNTLATVPFLKSGKLNRRKFFQLIEAEIEVIEQQREKTGSAKIG